MRRISPFISERGTKKLFYAVMFSPNESRKVNCVDAIRGASHLTSARAIKEGSMLTSIPGESEIQRARGRAGESRFVAGTPSSVSWRKRPDGRRGMRARRNEEAIGESYSHQPWRELQLARELQSEMLPACHPPEAGWDLAVRCRAAHTVGGDFYDFFRYPGKAISAEAIGDASGKGASAAIFAALAAGILRSLAPLELGPAEMLWNLNKALLKRPVRARYLSMIYATWDERDRVFRIANAGLPYPICVQNGKPRLLQASGLPLGLFESAEYEEHTVECSAGDLVIFYTDGVTEAVDTQSEEFGSEKLESVVAMNAGETAEHVVSAIFSAVAFHAGDLNAVDDQTVIAVRT
jgi:serine phosphatase RsbU (regulator of sigma subunit)